LKKLAFFFLVCGFFAVPSSAQAPPWEQEFAVWHKLEVQAKPWREDQRINGKTPEGFPDDFPVYFDNPDPSVMGETMWVTAIDYHPESDTYLGILINEPNHLENIRMRQNVAFAYSKKYDHLIASKVNDNFWEPGIPLRARGGPLLPLWEGIHHYRNGQMGHNMDGIRAGIALLEPLSKAFPPEATLQDRFLTHFVLGRCHAEAYNTDAAIEAFRKALQYRPEDLDANMALLAEYSIKVHTAISKDNQAALAIWGEQFTAHIGHVRSHFLKDPYVSSILAAIFNPEKLKDKKEDSEAIALALQYGTGTFRWKRR